MRQIRSLLMLLLIMVLLTFSVRAHAAGKVKTVYKGVTKSYSGKITKVYINGKKKSLTATPVFMKSGAYMGPMVRLFTESAFKVNCKKSGNIITLTYKNKKLTLKDGSKNATLNGVSQKNVLGASPMRNLKYAGSDMGRWILPLKSVCLRLGIGYKVSNKAIYLNDTSQTASVDKQSSVNNNSDTGSGTNSAVSSGSKTATTTSDKRFILVMDAGHGGVDSGAIGKLYKEKNLNLAIILGAKKYFDKDDRFKVYYTRTSDTYPSLDGRCKLANDNNADLFLCVHINAAGSSATGTETLYNNSRNASTKKNGLTSKSFATAMQAAVVKTTGFSNRGLVNRTGLRVLNKTKMPACLIEYGFISNPTQEKIMHANTTRYGKELYQALVSYLKNNRKIK